MKPRVLDLGVSNFEENLKGGDRSEFSTLCSEIQRLQSSFYKAELERTLLRAREEGLKAVLDYRSKGGGGVGEITHSTGEVEKLQRELELVLGELSREHCKNILIQDYKAKAKRGEVTLARLEGLRDVLLYQAARGELLRLLAEKESKEVSDLIVSLEEITQDFTAQAQAVTNFKTAVSSLKMDDDKDGLVPSDDLIMLRLHRLLGLGKTDLTSHLPTYSAIRAGLDNLTLEEARVTKELCDARQGREVQFQHLDRDTRHLTRQLGLQEGRQVSLGPRTVRDGVTSLETGIRELERNLKKLMDAWEKEKQELKNKPHLKLQRDAWLDFIVRPKVLAANIKSLENKVKN